MDNTYLSRMHLRRELIEAHHASTVHSNTVAEPAVLEFHSCMTKKYLPIRFPTIFRPRSAQTGPELYNAVSNSSLPLHPSSATSALASLGEHIDTDFLFLLPHRTAADGSPVYHLEAFVTCFPSGFNTREMCGLPLAAIHKPVPSYKETIEKSMDRFFAKIEVGRVVKRVNWSITTNDLLFAEEGNHLYVEGEEESSGDAGSVGNDIERQKQEVVIENCRLRCERQTLHRLPKTKALVFAFQTYQYTLAEVKAEGNGPSLAEAIDGLGVGNAPGMKSYKRGVIWGDRVKEYLLS